MNPVVFKKGSGTVVRSTLRAVPATVPDPFLKTIPDLRGDQGALVVYRRTPDAKVIRDRSKEELLGKYDAIFEPSYLALRSFVRVGGPESDLHLLNPMEFHANTTELVQMLEKGHHNVHLDDEAWDRLITWIDLNAPCHGSWSEFTPIQDSTVGPQRQRRLALRKLYGGIVDDGEDVVLVEAEPIEPIVPEPVPKVKAEPVEIPNWPFGAPDARRRQAAAGPVSQTIDLGGNVTLRLAKVPACSFVMGEPQGEKDERPPAAVTIAEPFWMSAFEITNAQFQQFDPSHDSRFEHRTSWIFSEEYLGWPVDRPQQPVVRVSWNEAMAFCRWLSKKLGAEVTLPTEGQWEYACRAGTVTPLFYGDLDADFSRFANVADATIKRLAYEGWRPKPPDLVPRDARFDDAALVTVEVGSYRPNPWSLYDMHGNAAEWTRSTYEPYPYREDDGRNEVANDGEKVVRGGSWYDRPKRCRSAFRLSYPEYQRVYNVGFRVVVHSAKPHESGTR